MSTIQVNVSDSFKKRATRASLRLMKIPEEKFKQAIREALNDKIFVKNMNPKMKENFEQFVNNDLVYFVRKFYTQKNLDILFKSI